MPPDSAMKSNQSQKHSITAGELMNQLEQEPPFIRQREERERLRKQAIELHKRASTPVLEELARAGFEVEGIADLYQLKSNYMKYKGAIPILLRWLPRLSHVAVKEEVVRALTDKQAKPVAAAILIEEFRRADSSWQSYKWAIGNALSVVADESTRQDIIELVKDRRHGRARERLAVALGNIRDAPVDVLIDLLNDDEIAGHALMALGKLRAQKARPHIQRFLRASQTWIRNEAKRALAKLDKANKNKLPALEEGD